MNKLIVPLLLILLFATTSCSDDAKKAIQNIAPQGEETLGDISNNRTILDPKLGNFCEKHECPDGIVAVKTEKKKLTCSGIAKSQTEVLISNNCASSDENFNIQTTDGKLIKVKSVEEELTNEFGDKVLKLNLEEKISTTANIDIPELEDKKVQLNYFNDLGELQTQNCELTYASLAYANSFDNESQLLNIKNCEGVRDGALISQNGKTIGFLTKKHDEIELYEGISLGGENQNINLMTKIEELSYQIATDSILQIGYMAFAYPVNDFEALREKVSFDKEQFIFTKKLICFKPGQESIHNDNVTRIIFNNEIQELTENTEDETFTTRNYIPRKEVFFGHKLGPKIPLKYNFISTNENLTNIEKYYFRNPLNNEVLFEKYKFAANKHNLEIIEYCN